MLASLKLAGSMISFIKLLSSCCKNNDDFILNRFPCLKEGMRLPDVGKCCNVIMACIVLHNIATLHRDHVNPRPEERDDERELYYRKNQHLSGVASEAGKAVRQHYVNFLRLVFKVPHQSGAEKIQ